MLGVRCWGTALPTPHTQHPTSALVSDRDRDPALHQLAVLVAPFVLVVDVERQAETADVLRPVFESAAGGNHVAGAHGRGVGVSLAAVHAACAGTTALRCGSAGRGRLPLDRPGEGVEVLGRDNT